MKRTAGLLVGLGKTLLVLGVVGLAAPPPAAAGLYSLQHLGCLQLSPIEGCRANDVNNAAQVTGETFPSDQAWKWDPDLGEMTPLFTPGTWPPSPANGINSLGDIVGSFDQQPFFFYDHTGVVTYLGPALQEEFGSPLGSANGVNDLGMVVGYAGNNRYDAMGDKAFVWDPILGAKHLPIDENFAESIHAWANDINSNRQIVGQMGNTAAMWQCDAALTCTWIYLPTIVPYAWGGSAAAVNASGQIVGYNSNSEPVLWNPPSSPGGSYSVQGLGVFPGQSANSFSEALDINNFGLIVGDNGDTPFVWNPAHGMLSLSDQLDSTGNGWLVWEATAINDNGQIVGSARNLATGLHEPVLLTPRTDYIDADDDGYAGEYGSPAVQGSDCDDNDKSTHPNAVDACDDVDQNCDGIIDGSNADGDGFTTCAGDCNDLSASIYPGATEVCNYVDDDCDGLVDEGVVQTYYLDNDADEYSDGTSRTGCSPLPRYWLPIDLTATSGDCNDSNVAIHPGAVEVYGNTIDENCDGKISRISITKATYGTRRKLFTVEATSLLGGSAVLQYQVPSMAQPASMTWNKKLLTWTATATLSTVPATVTVSVTVSGVVDKTTAEVTVTR